MAHAPTAPGEHDPSSLVSDVDSGEASVAVTNHSPCVRVARFFWTRWASTVRRAPAVDASRKEPLPLSAQWRASSAKQELP